MADDIVDRLRRAARMYPQWGEVAKPAALAADEIERLRAENAAWRTGVADAVEPFGFDRFAACGPADLLPGLVTLVERLADLRTVGSRRAEAAEEIERLRAALTDIRDLHQPMWVSEEAKAAGKKPWVCCWCGTADGSWPCDTRLVADEALAEQGDGR